MSSTQSPIQPQNNFSKQIEKTAILKQKQGKGLFGKSKEKNTLT